ncbi:PAS domain S-box-containing protein [Methylobacterium sp. 174MFSha1.1]|uniref:PAS domain S-box protein n=1 Tax=Methylobacterium sp. 174MFSha1.1 TaxID=1502749 RepID=UPI0008F1C828|nr:PAS domain S-box protein [Methylobacterium sp. 174MFSha1.1]SFV12451.1 PAS domain S-box-containing protein [Methylobacterium sp. 174MFSha1.1]
MTDRRETDRIDAEIGRSAPSHDPFAAAVRATRMPMLITDPHGPDNPIIFANAAFTKLTGYTRDEILGKNCRFLQGPETDRADVAKIRDAIERRVAIEIDLLNHKKNGERFWNRLLISPVFDENGELTYFFASQFDVTLERERLRDLGEALRRREQMLDALVRSSSEVRYRISADWSRLYQLSGGNFLADTTSASSDWIESYIPPQDRGALRAEIERAIRTKTSYSLEHRVYLADGSVGWASSRAVPVLDEEGRITEWYGAATDISERKEAEAASRDLTQSLGQQVADRTAEMRLYGDIVQSSAAPICAFDTGYRLIAFNQAHSDAFYRIFGRRVQVGEVFPDLFPPDQGAVMRGFMARALAGECYTVTEEFGDPDLAKPTWEVSYSPLRDGEGRVIGAFHFAKDISDRLRAEAELAATQEALRQSQKMEAVGQLTGGLAHDFNNLLAGISGSLELMQTRLAQGRFKDVERYMAAAQGAAKRAAALTHRLLAFSRRQTLDPRPTNVDRLARGMHELIQRTVGPGITLEVVASPEAWPALVDPSQLENALLNLCLNARDAMPEGGRITVSTANRTMDARTARRHDMPEGEYVRLRVTDTGTGMSPEVIARVFEPFFTTKPIGEGTGLGLSMIYGFAQQSGGQVRIASTPGEGTTVSLYLPRHAGAVPGEDETGTALPLARSTRGETVLVVDDEPTVRMLVTDILEDLGYTAIEAGDSAAGLKVLRSDVRIDLLVTDIGLPGGMNGRQMAEAARETRPDLKVLLITGYAETAILGNGTLGPGMAVLTKPFSIETMAARIRSIIEAGREWERRS